MYALVHASLAHRSPRVRNDNSKSGGGPKGVRVLHSAFSMVTPL
jgi:hypothetical protein